MKGKEYIKFLERWEFINNLSWEDAINNIKPEIVEDLLNEWSKIYTQSFKNDGIWDKDVGLPLIPTSAVGQIDSDLIANIALYNDRQIIQDPIDVALKEAAVNPLEYTPRFVSFLKKEICEVLKLKPLLDENR